jgi:hypothetical protein
MSAAARSPAQCPAGSRVSFPRSAGALRSCPVQPLVKQAEGHADAAGDGGGGTVGGLRLGLVQDCGGPGVTVSDCLGR